MNAIGSGPGCRHLAWSREAVLIAETALLTLYGFRSAELLV